MYAASDSDKFAPATTGNNLSQSRDDNPPRSRMLYAGKTTLLLSITRQDLQQLVRRKTLDQLTSGDRSQGQDPTVDRGLVRQIQGLTCVAPGTSFHPYFQKGDPCNSQPATYGFSILGAYGKSPNGDGRDGARLEDCLHDCRRHSCRCFYFFFIA